MTQAIKYDQRLRLFSRINTINHICSRAAHDQCIDSLQRALALQREWAWLEFLRSPLQRICVKKRPTNVNQRDRQEFNVCDWEVLNSERRQLANLKSRHTSVQMQNIYAVLESKHLKVSFTASHNQLTQSCKSVFRATKAKWSPNGQLVINTATPQVAQGLECPRLQRRTGDASTTAMLRSVHCRSQRQMVESSHTQMSTDPSRLRQVWRMGVVHLGWESTVGLTQCNNHRMHQNGQFDAKNKASKISNT